MSWEEKLILWEKDEKQPMTQISVDRRYASNRLGFGRKLIKFLNIDFNDKKVLDVAVGTGGVSCAFAEAGAEIYGLDVNDYFLEISRERFKDMGLEHKDIKKWNGNDIPYFNEEFDFVICTDTLEHTPNYKHLIKEMCRVLKIGGNIFVGSERRWFPLFILWNPHDGAPFTILLPRTIRKFIDEKILKKPCLDYKWFSFFFEISNEFKKHNVDMNVFDYIKDEGFDRLKKNFMFPEVLRGCYKLMMLHGLGVKK